VPVMGLPQPPTRLRAIATSASQVVLHWQDNAANETAFKIQRSLSADGPWTLLAATGADVSTFADSDLGASTTHFYRVRAVNTLGRSPWSNPASATPLVSAVPPGFPGFLTATAISPE